VQQPVESVHRQLTPLELAIGFPRRKSESVLTCPSHHRPRSRLDREALEDNRHCSSHGLVGVELESRVPPQVADRRVLPELAASRLVEASTDEAQTKPVQLGLGHRAFEI